MRPTIFFILLFSTLLVLDSATASDSEASTLKPSTSTVEKIATFPAGTFLENLLLQSDGSILFTNYFEKTVLILNTDGDVNLFAKLDQHPISIEHSRGGYLVNTHRIPFTKAPEFTSGNGLVRLDENGTVISQAPTPDAHFLNGMHRLESGKLLVADSIAGTVWEVNETSDTLSPWFKHEKLLPDQEQEPFLPGANGIKSIGNSLFISNSSRGEIYERNPIDDGPLELFSKTGAVDDFVIDEDGTIYATTHGEKLLKISQNGSVTELVSSGCGGCTSVTISSDRTSLIFINDGDFFSGTPKESSISIVKDFKAK